jgi:histidinol phosphatase-like enzyme
MPGLFEQVVAEFPDVTAGASVMIGDSLSDIEFGRTLGMQTIFIEGNSKHGKPASRKPANWPICVPLPWLK